VSLHLPQAGVLLKWLHGLNWFLNRGYPRLILCCYKKIWISPKIIESCPKLCTFTVTSLSHRVHNFVYNIRAVTCSIGQFVCNSWDLFWHNYWYTNARFPPSRNIGNIHNLVNIRRWCNGHKLSTLHENMDTKLRKLLYNSCWILSFCWIVRMKINICQCKEVTHNRNLDLSFRGTFVRRTFRSQELSFLRLFYKALAMNADSYTNCQNLFRSIT